MPSAKFVEIALSRVSSCFLARLLVVNFILLEDVISKK